MFPLKDKRIRIGGWWSVDPRIVSEEYIKRIADCGADFIMSGNFKDTGKIKELLSYCDKYGIECIIYDERIYDNEDIDIGEITKEYSGYKSYMGNMIKDEPGVAEFDHLRRVYDKFKAQTPGKDAYINLLPMYASAAQLKYGAGVQEIDYYDTPNTTYGENLDEYCKAFDTPYICVDVYPCRTEEDGITRAMYPGYLENLSQMAHFCRKYDREFWVMVQSIVWYETPSVPTEKDLRWQFFTVLSFGAKAIFHFCLSTPDGHSTALLDPKGMEGPLYFPAQRIHRFIRSIDDVYYQYKHVGAFNVNWKEGYEFLKFEEQYKNFNTIEEIISDDQLLVGCFDKEDGDGHAFTIVNMTHLKDNKTAHVKLKIKGKKVTAYAETMSYVLGEVDGYYDITLPSGEGLFITVE